MAIAQFSKDMAIIQKLDDEPNDVGGLSAAELKAKFDEGGEAIKEYINNTLLPNVPPTSTTINGHPLSGNVTVTKDDVGLGNVDNTSDVDKPVSTAQQAALDLKSDKTNVLEKDNSTDYTPTQNYHPATKKYVDETLSGAVLGQLPDNSIEEEKLSPDLRTYIAQQMPAGGIIMWSGASDAIPSGWALCDGQNGTPDLRGRFILGAGGTYQAGNSGGAETHQLTTNELPSHTHTFSNGQAVSAGSHSHSDSFSVSSSGSHSHGFSYTGASDKKISVGNTYQESLAKTSSRSGTTDSSGSHSHFLTGSISSGGAHTHTVTATIGNTGNGQAMSIMPPYYALCFIMKL